MPDSTIYQRPAELLQALIRFDTTNPPGDEAECINYIDGLLQSIQQETILLAKNPARPNLIARLKGAGSAPPLLLYGHVDVVPTVGQPWTQPPFSGEIIGDELWGRGTLDMKGGIAMMLAAFMKAKVEGTALPGDVVLCVVSDEEAGGDDGAKFLVEEHAELFAGIRYALGELGGFSSYFGGKCFYPIQVAEKGICWMRATMRGQAGHASMPMPGGAIVKLADMLAALGTERLPVHVTPPAQMMLEAMMEGLEGEARAVIENLLDPEQTDAVLDELGEAGRSLNAVLHNTASPTIIQASTKTNVLPGTITVEIDGRLLPGQTPAEMVSEIRELIDDEIEIEIVRADSTTTEIDMSLFDMLADILREADPEAIPVPMLMPAVTDGRFFSRLGIQTYGFNPMKLPQEMDFLSTIHNADERIPVAALDFGTEAIFKAMQRFGEAST